MSSRTKTIIFAVFILVLGFILGKATNSSSVNSDHSQQESSSKTVTSWTCSMHPQINLPKKGKCPICSMDLIPVASSSSDDEGERVLKMTKASMKLADISTQAIEKREAFVNLNLFGKVAVDTTRISDMAILADGEIRKLFVNYAGIPVKKGEHLAEVYSPDVYTAGQDYLVALNSSSTDTELIESSKVKLTLLGVPQDYIELINKTRKVPDTYTLKSPINGFVQNLIGYQGMWIKKGQMLCRIIDMSTLWIELDVYEADLAWVRYGQDVTIKAEAVYGKGFKGIVSYIPPSLDDKTRTIKVRVNVDNSKGQLKPNMFVSASLKAKVTALGYVTSSKLKGKWISPMHPEIIKDKAGTCDVCGMQLVQAKELGFEYDENEKDPILVPASSVLITGKRAVVYVKITEKPPTFEGREIEIGPKTGNSYVVLSGLKVGERVVTKGGFKIDSALQLQAKPSMMSAEGGDSLLRRYTKKGGLTTIHNEALKESLDDFVSYYLEIQANLASDKFEGMSELAKTMLDELEYVDYSSLKKNELELWTSIQKKIEGAIDNLIKAKSLKELRNGFKETSKAIIFMVEKVGHKKKTIHKMYCSMVDSSWLQLVKKVANPYYGSGMLGCGELKSSLPSSPKAE